MALTEEQFDAWWKENGIESSTFAEKSAARKGWNAAISALPKLEPAEDFICRFRRHVGGDGEFWLHELEDFYTEAPITPPASEPDDTCFDDIKLAEMILSDCGCSTINSRSLVERVADRIARHKAPPASEQKPFGCLCNWGKAQRDALLKSLEEALECGEDGDWQSARRVLVSAIASVKGGAE